MHKIAFNRTARARGLEGFTEVEIPLNSGFSVLVNLGESRQKATRMATALVQPPWSSEPAPCEDHNNVMRAMLGLMTGRQSQHEDVSFHPALPTSPQLAPRIWFVLAHAVSPIVLPVERSNLKSMICVCRTHSTLDRSGAAKADNQPSDDAAAA